MMALAKRTAAAHPSLVIDLLASRPMTYFMGGGVLQEPLVVFAVVAIIVVVVVVGVAVVVVFSSLQIQSVRSLPRLMMALVNVSSSENSLKVVDMEGLEAIPFV